MFREGGHLADPLFQALVPTTANAIDSILVDSVRDTWERILASQLLWTQPAADSFDGLNWDDARSELDWQGMGHRPGGRDATRVTSPATDAPVNAPRAALDQYFAQVADDMDPKMDEE